MAVVLTNTKYANGITVGTSYWRLNSFDQLPNRQADGTYSVAAVARFRVYASEADFTSGNHSIDFGTGVLDQIVSFTPSAIGANLADEAYVALKALAAFSGATDA